METLLRLDTKSPDLATAYRQANDDQRRRAALQICSAAAEQTELQGDEIDAGFAVLRRAQTHQTIRKELDRLAEQLDEEYFKLSEEAGTTTPEALIIFRQARAAAAWGFALSPEPGELHEALYEAIFAFEDETEVARLLETALRAT